MVRIANSDIKTSNWHTSKIDPDVRYKITPLTNLERTEILNYSPAVRPEGAAKNEQKNDVTWITTMLFRASLKATEGILDPDNDNKELEFKFHQHKLSKKLTIELCQRELYNKIPDDLLGEIMDIARDGNDITEENQEDINFTSSSSGETSTEPVKPAMETIPSVESKAADTVSESAPITATEKPPGQ